MAIILLSILPLCVRADNTLIPPSAVGGVRSDYSETTSVLAMATNIYKQGSGALSGRDRQMHIKTVIFAASWLETGSTAEWTNPDNGTAGRVKIVMTRPAQGGYCRLLFTQVEKGGHIREYSEYACKTIDSQYWSFSDR